MWSPFCWSEPPLSTLFRYVKDACATPTLGEETRGGGWKRAKEAWKKEGEEEEVFPSAADHDREIVSESRLKWTHRSCFGAPLPSDSSVPLESGFPQRDKFNRAIPSPSPEM